MTNQGINRSTTLKEVVLFIVNLLMLKLLKVNGAEGSWLSAISFA